MRVLALFAACLLGGCGSVTGVLLDAGTNRPVADAVVRMTTVGWGRRNGQLVWDADTIHETRTDSAGRFRFNVGAGGRLQVVSDRGSFDHGSLCKPLIARVGGPFAAVETDRRLIFGMPGKPAPADSRDPRSLTGDQLGLSASGPAFEDAFKPLTLRSSLGIAFVQGTGEIPAWPAAERFVDRIDFDPLRQCGWLFARTPLGRAVVDLRTPLSGGDVGSGNPYWLALFAMLPNA